MIKKHGLNYYEDSDIKKLFYKDQGSVHLEALTRSGLLIPQKYEDVIKWAFISAEHDLQFLLPSINIMAIPMEIISDLTYLHHLQDMIKNPVIATGRRTIELSEIIDELSASIETKLYEYELNKDSIKTQSCYVWYFNNENFEGVFNVIPQQLLDGPLGEKVIFNCDSCSFSVRTSDIPEMFYDPETNKLFCPSCANMSNLRLKHVGN